MAGTYVSEERKVKFTVETSFKEGGKEFSQLLKGAIISMVKDKNFLNNLAEKP